jgi:gluconate kinase
MGIKNYLIEGISGTGKTTVCYELKRRGYHAINGDTDLAYQGDPITGEALDTRTHEHHSWNLDKIRSLVNDKTNTMTFFCGGSRNNDQFIDLFDQVFVLEVDIDTLNERLAKRRETEWGGNPSERQFIQKLHAIEEDTLKNGVRIDATLPISRVVGMVLEKCN